jgi:hypothetical protein
VSGRTHNLQQREMKEEGIGRRLLAVGEATHKAPQT